MARRGQSAAPNLLDGVSLTDPESLAKVEGRVREYVKIGFLQMNRAQEPFIRVKNIRGRTPRTRLFESGNQVGKTTIGVAEDIAHALGFRPWLLRADPDFKIPIQVPNSGIVGCEVAGQTLAMRIEPEFMNLIPKGMIADIGRYSDGSIKNLTLDNRSTINFRSYVQGAETWEGVISHWVHFDEPPPKEILTAATRGLMSTNGTAIYTMTPLKEAYIYDLLSLHAFNNGGDDQEIAVFRGSTWDNCQDWCKPCDCYIPENDPERLEPGQVRPVNNCPKCGAVMGFLPRAGIQNFLKNITDPDEREAREEGKWKHLSGLVYKELDREKHIYDDFEIPKDWMRVESVDPADSKPTRWLFGAVSPEDISVNGKKANRIYWCGYLLASGTINGIAKQVKVKRAELGYKEPAMVVLDAKFGAKTINSGDETTSWEEKLDDAGIKHIILSHSSPGDVSLGHKMVKEYLKPHYSALRGGEFPGMLFSREGCKGNKGPIQCMFNYQWDTKKEEKPEEQYKDFPDCVRYIALEQPQYKEPLPDIDPDLARMLLARDNRAVSVNPLYHGLQMKGI